MNVGLYFNLRNPGANALTLANCMSKVLPFVSMTKRLPTATTHHNA